MLTFEIPAVKCLHGVEVNWSQYRDTSVTDPALVASEIKAESVHYRPLPLDSRFDFFIGYSRPPFEKCIAPGAFIRINTVIVYIFFRFRFGIFYFTFPNNYIS